MPQAVLSTQAVANGTGVPEVCVRHGLSATRRVPCTFLRRPPRWLGLMALFPILLLPGVVVYLVKVLGRRVRVAEWPFCDACMIRRRSMMWTGWGLLVGGVVAAVLPWVMVDPDSQVSSDNMFYLWVFFLGVVAFIAGIVFVDQGSRRGTAGGVVTSDGSGVEFKRASTRFAREALLRGRGEQAGGRA